jgi:biopolymer transport protein ExbB
MKEIISKSIKAIVRAYNHLVYRIDKVVSQMEARTMAFMDLLNEPNEK